MDVTLISFDRELYCIGVRILSAVLRKAGHNVQCVFLPIGHSKQSGLGKFQETYPENLLDSLYTICKQSRLIGMSLMTNQFIQAVQITKYFKGKNLDTPIIWGGIEPTVEPDECLEFADAVCLGEGEDAILELAGRIEKGEDYSSTLNMWVKVNGKVIRNPVRPLEVNLDVIPLPDYSSQNHFIGNDGRLEKLTREKLVNFKGERFISEGRGISYSIITSRGCPFACTYCCNNVYKELYHKQKRLRWRSIENVIQELKMIQEEVSTIRFIYMVDDNFTSRPSEKLEQFLIKYQKEINIPFAVQISPLTINEEKLDMLFDYGCAKVTMGVETASGRVSKIYGREKFHKQLPEVIELVERYRTRMKIPPTYQFIIDNPYETLNETIESLNFAVALPKPWNNPIYSLMLFPGTSLFKRAVADGLVYDKYIQIYGRNWLDQSEPFFQFWIRLYRANMPRVILKLLLKRLIVNILTRPISRKALRICVWFENRASYLSNIMRSVLKNLGYLFRKLY
jgi:anaerobic magnesium-protoporphyrin IX monomethyl ester cyclase